MKKYLISICVGCALTGLAYAQSNRMAMFGERISALSDARNPERVASRAFDQVLQAKQQVTEALRGVVQQEPEFVFAGLNGAQESLTVALIEFQRLAELDVSGENFGSVSFFAASGEETFGSFQEVMNFMAERVQELIESIEATRGGVVNEFSLRTIIEESQRLEDYVATYFGFGPTS